ncbi:adenylate kinase [Cichlidogyrus casuarinus]|uniref:Adenylate kinase n=1 Tax=Cichlidogyrus casuarinus TaxID=1844966 RepID=A0ABD2QGA9_9PLAT
MQTELGNSFREKLLSGEKIENASLVELIKKKLSAPECHHYGYVLDDFPIFSINTNPKTIEDQIDLLRKHELRPDIIIYLQLTDEDLANRIGSFRYDAATGKYVNAKHYTDLPTIAPPQVEKTVAPDKAPKKDEENLEFEEAGADDEVEEENEEENLDEEILKSHPDFPRIPQEEVDLYLKLPQSTEEEIFNMMQFFKQTVWPQLMPFMQELIPLNLINLDGNLSPIELFQTLMANFTNIHILPACVPIKFYGQKKKQMLQLGDIVPEVFDGKAPNEDSSKEMMEQSEGDEDELDGVENVSEHEEEQEDEEIPEDLEDEELFKTLSIKQLPAVSYRWKRSCFGRLCPVNLYNGKMTVGKIEFAVGFMGEIYLLADKNNFDLFLQNPRPYLSKPENPVRWALIGVPDICSEDVANILAIKHKACLIDVNVALRKVLRAQMRVKLEALLEDQDEKEKLIDPLLDSFCAKIDKHSLLNAREKLIFESDPAEEEEELMGKFKAALDEPILLDPEIYLSILESEMKARLSAMQDESASSGHWIILGLPPLREIWQAMCEREETIKQIMEERKELENKISQNAKARLLRDAKKQAAELKKQQKQQKKQQPKQADLGEEEGEDEAEDEEVRFV